MKANKRGGRSRCSLKSQSQHKNGFFFSVGRSCWQHSVDGPKIDNGLEAFKLCAVKKTPGSNPPYRPYPQTQLDYYSHCSSLIWRTITTPTAVRSYGVLVVVVVVVVVVVLVLFPSLFSRRAPCPNLASPFVFRSLSSLPAFLRSPLFGILAALCVFLYGVHATFAVWDASVHWRVIHVSA